MHDEFQEEILLLHSSIYTYTRANAQPPLYDTNINNEYTATTITTSPALPTPLNTIHSFYYKTQSTISPYTTKNPNHQFLTPTNF